MVTRILATLPVNLIHLKSVAHSSKSHKTLCFIGYYEYGGEGGIRTHETLASLTAAMARPPDRTGRPAAKSCRRSARGDNSSCAADARRLLRVRLQRKRLLWP